MEIRATATRHAYGLGSKRCPTASSHGHRKSCCSRLPWTILTTWYSPFPCLAGSATSVGTATSNRRRRRRSSKRIKSPNLGAQSATRSTSNSSSQPTSRRVTWRRRATSTAFLISLGRTAPSKPSGGRARAVPSCSPLTFLRAWPPSAAASDSASRPPTATTARLQTRRLSLAASCSRRAARATTRTWAPASNPRPPTCAPSPRRSSTRRA
mmetsp:Transcript_37361/g.82196  ORF Transcript_37361/g.82196 Transcript_37361/m.82196 type:complete len:211 (-) Transcript_37361:1622-2254(-)